MAIKVYNNKIMIGDYTLQETIGGLSFDGQITAESYYTSRAFQGTIAGYTAGGLVTPPAASNVVDKFPFSADANALDVGDLFQARYSAAGCSSYTHGYSAGGQTVPTSVNTIDKFSFASNRNAFSVGSLITTRQGSAGHSSQTQGFVSGGVNIPSPGVEVNVIERFPFAQDLQTFDVGDLTVARRLVAGHSSTEKGYISGGQLPPGTTLSNVIDSFPFTNSESTCSDVGDLSQARSGVSGHSSTTNGYSNGGANPTLVTAIDKFPFATNSNATNVLSLLTARAEASGTGSDQRGYSAGGGVAPFPTGTANIERFNFHGDGAVVSVSVGNLSVTRSLLGSVGTQI